MNSFNDFKVPQIHSAGIAHFFPSVPSKLKKNAYWDFNSNQSRFSSEIAVVFPTEII